MDIDGLRTVSLLRVSTDKQATIKDKNKSKDKDIPAQREIVNRFIKQHSLVLVKELVEGGVSGFKTKVSDRDALVQIKHMAKTKQFDVLVVYKSDRIGRTTDESPLVIKYLNDCGVRVFTTSDGEIKSSTQIDKLMTYLMFWQNETESVKLSERVSDYQAQMIRDGRYRGGGKDKVPYGYHLEDLGSVNPKGKRILDLVISEDKKHVVELIFKLSGTHNLGARAIARYLNEEGYGSMSPNSNGWNFRTIDNILNNQTYKGYLHMKRADTNEIIISPKLNNLAIVTEEVWDLSYFKKQKRRVKKDTPSNRNAYISPALFQGIIYCGYCGSKMQVWNNHKTRQDKNGEIKKIIATYYKCPTSATTTTNKCAGQRTYSINQTDPKVEDAILNFVKNYAIEKSSHGIVEEFNKKKIELENIKKQKASQLSNKKQELLVLKKEIAKALMGDSKFTSDILSESISQTQSEIEGLQESVSEMDYVIAYHAESASNTELIKKNYNDWMNKYNSANVMDKRALINSIIEKVVVYRDSINVKMKITKDTYSEFSAIKGCVI